MLDRLMEMPSPNTPRVLIAGLAAVALATSIAAVVFFRENRELRARLAATHDVAETATVPVVSETRARGPSETTDDASATVAATGSGTPGSASDRRDRARDRGADRRDRGAETMARALSDPDARAAMLGRFKAGIDRQFGALFVKLGLNEEQAETLRTLLAERQMAQTDAGFLARTASDDRGRTEAEAWRDAQLQSINAGIDAILGPDGTKILEGYQASMPQRQAVDDIARRASYAGDPLSSEASDRLVKIMSDVQRDVPVANELIRGGNRQQQQQPPFSQDTVDRYLASVEAQNRAMLAAAKDVLSSAQLEALAARQLERYEQSRAQLNYRLKNPNSRDGPDFGGLGGNFGGRGGG